MYRQKCEKLRYVAPIGFERFGRHAPLVAEIAQPAGNFGGNVGLGLEFAHGGKSGTASFTLP